MWLFSGEMVIQEKAAKLKITVDNTLPLHPLEEANEKKGDEDEEENDGLDDVVFLDLLNCSATSGVPFQDRLRDEVEITRPFKKRKRYQNPYYYVKNEEQNQKVNEEDTGEKEKLQQLLAEEQDLSAAEKLKRKQNRAKTFGHVWGEIIAPECDLIQRYQLKTGDEKKSKVRTTAIYVQGVTDFSTEQVFEYFKPYPPESLEWIDDDSCNIVYDSDKECSSCFLQYLFPTMPEYYKVPIKLPIDKKIEASDSSKENNDEDSVEDGEVEEDEATLDKVPEEPDPTMSKKCFKLGNDIVYVKAPPRENLDSSRVLTSIWRYGPVQVVNDQIVVMKCRYAVEMDRKEMYAMLKSKYYQEKGNPHFGNMVGVISNSFKERYLQKRGILKNSNPSVWIKNPVQGSVFNRLGNKGSFNDPDTPFEDLRVKDVRDLLRRRTAAPIAESRMLERKMEFSESEDDEESEVSEVSKSESEEENPMTSKSQKKMKMYADELAQKVKRHSTKKVLKRGVIEPASLKQTPILKVEMVNEYAERNLRRLEAKKRAKEVGDEISIRNRPGGFVDTRELFKKDIEEAEKEVELTPDEGPSRKQKRLEDPPERKRSDSIEKGDNVQSPTKIRDKEKKQSESTSPKKQPTEKPIEDDKLNTKLRKPVTEKEPVVKPKSADISRKGTEKKKRSRSRSPVRRTDADRSRRKPDDKVKTVKNDDRERQSKAETKTSGAEKRKTENASRSDKISNGRSREEKRGKEVDIRKPKVEKSREGREKVRESRREDKKKEDQIRAERKKRERELEQKLRKAKEKTQKSVAPGKAVKKRVPEKRRQKGRSRSSSSSSDSSTTSSSSSGGSSSSSSGSSGSSSGSSSSSSSDSD